MQSDIYLKRVRSLIICLFISGSLNILCIAFLFFWVFRDHSPSPYLEFKPKPFVSKESNVVVGPTNDLLLKQYKALSYESLLQKLMKTHLVEDGFTERDLALGTLITFHDFNLEKALEACIFPTQKRLLSFNQGKEKAFVYSGLSNEHFEAILHFAKTEKWPFKSRGLFLLLKKEQFKEEPSLYEAFYLTDEFLILEDLFKGMNIQKEELIRMVQGGDWGTLSAFIEKQRRTPDLSSDNRERLLLAYVKMGSKEAAKIIIKTDFAFVAKRLSDATVMSIVRLIHENTPESLRFLSLLAASQRGDQVKALALAKYREQTGSSWEPLVSRSQPPPIEKVIPFKPIPKESVYKTITLPPSKNKNVLYIVQDGDNLWKIARRFKVSVDNIRKINQLKNDFLKPGTPLKIPIQ